MFRLALVDFVILDGVEQTLLRQLGLIITRAITVTTQARSHLFLSGILVNGNECFLLAICHPRGLSSSFNFFLLLQLLAS